MIVDLAKGGGNAMCTNVFGSDNDRKCLRCIHYSQCAERYEHQLQYCDSDGYNRSDVGSEFYVSLEGEVVSFDEFVEEVLQSPEDI
jgi:hypothetical protein